MSHMSSQAWCVSWLLCIFFLCFFFNDTATTEIYTLSLHDALPISSACACCTRRTPREHESIPTRSEEHTSELQSLAYLVCRLLLEKKKQTQTTKPHHMQTLTHFDRLANHLTH